MQYCTRNPALKKPELSDAASIIDINDNMDVIDGIICKNNFNAAIDPSTGDDIGDGYAVGSNWWNVTDHRLFVAESVSTGAAVWRQIYPVSASSTDHGSLTGLSDDDHTQYIKHALATAANDFLVASGPGVFVKKSLSETQTILVPKWSINEIPTGSINGVNMVFTFAHTPIDQIMLYLNGQYMTPDEDYTISGVTITMASAPIVGDKIIVNYPYLVV